MAQQVINIGAAPNDGTGDALRVALDKTNSNFAELYGVAGGLGSAANQEASAFATAAQGDKADTAVQPEDPAQVAEVVDDAYTILSADANKVRILTDATGVAVTLPNDLPQGFLVTIIQGGDGQLTFAPDTGATMETADDYTKTRVKGSSALAMVKANVGETAAAWLVIGDLTDV